jgi:hypothetical protein
MRGEKASPEERFWKNVAPEPNSGCWIWLGRGKRYGHLRANGQAVPAHRFSLQLTGVDVPPGAYVLHKCDVTFCVNPDHLYVGNQQDNMRDAAMRGRRARGPLPFGVRSEHGRRWRAQVKFQNVLFVDGPFDSIEAAHARALNIKGQLYG